MMNRKIGIAVLGLLALLFLKGIWPALTILPETPNLYVLQAQAFLEGRFDIGTNAHDAALYNNHYYVVFPPFPALLLVPFVWVFGTAYTNTVLVCLGLTILNIWLLYKILRSQLVDKDISCWMIAGFFMGTAYWMAVKGSFGVWHFAHIICVTMLFCAFYTALCWQNSLLAGLFLGLAFLSRHMALYALPFLACAVWEKKRSFSHVFILCGGVLAALCVYLYANWLRFDNPFDTGYSHILQTGYLKARLDQYGLFHVDYFPFNFIFLFLQGFHVEFSGETMMTIHCLDPFGTSLTFASPFVFTAFWAKWRQPLLAAAWTSILLICLHTLFYYSNGYYQINAQRFTLDFLPILIILAGLGAQQCNSKIWKSLIVYSIGLNLVASIICSLSP